MWSSGCLRQCKKTHFVADAVGCSEEDVQAMVLGGHGDTMVPLPRFTTVGGIAITHLLDESTIEAICQRTASGGGEIVKLLERGSAFYAPASSAIEMAESFLKDQRRLLPCAAWCNGEYGLDGIFVGVPAIIGKNGIEKVIEIKLNDEEKTMFDNSVEAVRQLNSIASKME